MLLGLNIRLALFQDIYSDRVLYWKTPYDSNVLEHRLSSAIIGIMTSSAESMPSIRGGVGGIQYWSF